MEPNSGLNSSGKYIHVVEVSFNMVFVLMCGPARELKRDCILIQLSVLPLQGSRDNFDIVRLWRTEDC